MHSKPLFGRRSPRAVAKNGASLTSRFRPSFEPLESREMLSADDLLIGLYDGGGVLRYNESADVPAQGSVAAGANGLTNVSSVAAAPDGTFYVSSLSTDQVLHYSNSGTYLGEFPVTGTGYSIGAPGSLAFGPNGDLYVADLGGSSTVDWFNTSTDTLDGSVTVPTDNGVPGAPGGIAFAHNGDLIVGNLGDGSVLQYNSDGSYAYLIDPYTAVGTNDSGDGDDPFLEPSSILVENNGNMLIADLNLDGSNNHHQVVLYTASSGATSQFINLTTPEGTDGSAGDYAQPESLLLDQDGNLLVGVSPDHNDNGAVEEYNINSGHYVSTVVSGIGTPAGLAYVPAVQSDLLVGDYDDSDVLRYNAATDAPVPGGVAAGAGGLAAAAGVAVAPDGTYYVSSFDTDQVLHFNSAGTFLGDFPINGANYSIDAPGSLAFGPNGDLYIADLGGSSSVYWFNTSTDTLDGSVTLPTDYGVPGTPGGIAFAYNGDLIVGNLSDGSVVEFDSSGDLTYLVYPYTAAGPNDSDDTSGAPFIMPASIVVEPDGNLLIADENFDQTNYHHQIVLYNATTGAVSPFINLTAPEGTGDSEGDYAQPESMLLSQDGNLLVEVSPDHNENGAVQEYSLSTTDLISTLVSGIGTPAGIAYIRSSPIVTTTDGSTGYTAGAAPVAVDSGVTISDANTAPDLSATVSITGNFTSGDVLAMASQNGITASYAGGTGVLTVTGNSATVAEFQTALQSITFTSTSTSTASRTISFTVTDGTAIGVAAIKEVEVFAPATITGIYVRGSGSGTGVNWTTNFLNYLDAHSTNGVADGSGTLGYALRTGSTQTTVLPWANINTITVTFSEPVTINTGTSGLALYGSSSGPAVPTLSATTSTSGVTSITWTLSSDLGDDKYLLEIPTTAVLDSRNAPLDGAFTNGSSTFPSGTGLAGSANFGFTFNVLPGSAGQANAVSSSYATTARSHTNDLYNNGAYSPYYDLDGEGVISSAYATFIRSHTDNILPSAAPTTGSGENTPLIEVDPGLILDSSPSLGVDSPSLIADSASPSSALGNNATSGDSATQNAASAIAQIAAAPVIGGGSPGPASQTAQADAVATATLAASSQPSQDSQNQAVDDALSDLDLTDVLI